MQFTYITTKKELEDVCQALKKEKIIAIDLECENNLHHYGAYITLLQISTKDKNYLVDLLQLGSLSCLKAILEDKTIEKIFHDVSFDLRMLSYQYSCYPQNIFDTQLAALFLGKEKIGLGSLLEEYFAVEKVSKHQKADWAKRPLSQDMLAYAIKDTLYLLKLRQVLVKELEEKKRLGWVQEECAYVVEKRMIYEPGTVTSVRGYRLLSPIERGRLHALYKEREKCAKLVDRPVHFVLSTRLLLEIAAKPLSLAQWKKLQKVHPMVRKRAEIFFQAVQQATPISFDPPQGKRYTPKQKAKAEQLYVIQEQLQEKHGIRKHLFMSKEQLRDIVVTSSLESLRAWQKKLVEPLL